MHLNDLPRRSRGVLLSVYAVYADMCAPPLFPTTKAGELHRLARGMIECDVEMPDVGLVTVAVTHLVHAYTTPYYDAFACVCKMSFLDVIHLNTAPCFC